MRILLFGKNGQVGWELQRTLASLGEVIAVGRPEIDFLDLKGLQRFTLEIKPDLIVNAAAYTSVDKAESEPEIVMTVNGEAPGVLAGVAKKLGAGLVHYSTDYVFDGTKRVPYTEEDEPNPINEYGETKLAGERAIADMGESYLILRTSWVYSLRGSNFLLTMLRLAREQEELRVVNDQVGCPTWSGSVALTTANLLAKLIEDGDQGSIHWRMGSVRGIYHACSDGSTTWYDFAKAIVENDPLRQEQVVREVMPISSSEYPTAARRPKYSVLATEKLKARFGLEMDSWRTQLATCWNVGKSVGVLDDERAG